MRRSPMLLAAALMGLGLGGSTAIPSPDRLPAPKAPTVAAPVQRKKKKKPERRRYVSTGTPFPRVAPLPTLDKPVRLRTITRLVRRIDGESRQRQRRVLIRRVRHLLGQAK